MTELARCACGDIPTRLDVDKVDQFDVILIHHCQWAVLMYWPDTDPPDVGITNQAWNSAPRAEQ